MTGLQMHLGPSPERTIEAAFVRFHEENPQVYRELLRLSRQWRQRRGRDAKCGAKMLYEVARWNLTLATVGEPVKLNNNYTALYARMLMREPGLDGMFETRRLNLP